MPKTSEQTPASKTPTYFAYQVRNIGENDSFWTRIGTVWQHKDGHGFNIELDAFPRDGKVILRTPAEQAK